MDLNTNIHCNLICSFFSPEKRLSLLLFILNQISLQNSTDTSLRQRWSQLSVLNCEYKSKK